MDSFNSATATIETNAVPFRVNPADHLDLDNIVVSPCGSYIVSFDYKGNHHVIDWDELAPPGAESEDEEGTPHEEFMAELDRYVEELEARRGDSR
jgi:hypothetical protein